MPRWIVRCLCGCDALLEVSFTSVEARDKWLEYHEDMFEVVPAVSNFKIEGYTAKSGYSEKETKSDS